MARFLTLADVADELQLSIAAVRALVHSGELEAFQVGGRGQWRVDSEKFESFIEGLHNQQRERIQHEEEAKSK